MAQSLAKIITHITSSTKHHKKATFQDELRGCTEWSSMNDASGIEAFLVAPFQGLV